VCNLVRPPESEVESALALEPPLSDLIGHELRGAVPQGSRFTSSYPCLGKEHLSVEFSSRTLVMRSLSCGSGVCVSGVGNVGGGVVEDGWRRRFWRWHPWS
jgi:hypothetical protein